MDEFDANTIPYDEHDDHDDAQVSGGSNRRSFLKAAVVGSAAAVAVSGVGAATLTLTGRHTGLTRFVALGATVSGPTSDACTTNTSDPLAEQTTYNKQESIYLWFKVNNVPGGTYTFNISPTIGGPLTIVKYQGATSNVHVYEYAGGSTSFACHPPSLSGLPKAIATSTALPIHVKFTGTKDLLLQVHLQGKKGNSGGTVNLTVTLYQGSTTGGTVEATKNVSFTLA